MLSRQFLVVGLFLALFALFTPPPPYMGLNAQETPPDPISGPELTEPEQPDMAYQPPADADELSDFLPPEGEIIEAPPAQPITPTLPITPTVPFTPTVDITATTSVTAVTAVTVTEPITKLVSFEEGKVAVVFEGETLTDTAEIQLTLLPLPQDPLTATNTLSNPVGSLVLQKFQIEVAQAGEIVSDEFSKPVRLIVDLRSLMGELDASYQTWTYYLAYQDKTDPDIWIEVPLDVYQPDGLFSAEVMHFSNWAAGVRPERWNPSWTPPTVSAFSGAVTFNYPLELPPGRHGLQPALSLSYSSRGLDGRIRDAESGPIADGWSLGGISVVRVGVRMDAFNNTPLTFHPDKFRLVFNGTGHELFPAAGANTTTDATVRYYVKDAPGYYLERNYEANTAIVPNQDGIYWILITPDGTRYRLGFTADAEEWQYTSHHSHLNVQGHIGRTHGNGAVQYSAIAWHVDTVTDPFGNQMSYDYYTWNTDENIQWWNTDHWTSFTLTTRKNRIHDIKYNYPTRVTSLPAADTVARLTSTPATRIEFRPSGNLQYINSIFIYHGSGALPISEYRIDSQNISVNSPGCINEDTQPNTERQSSTRIVKSIRRWVNVDGNAATNDANGYALPPTTFYYGNNLGNQNEYNPLAHFTKNSQPCFRFLYLHGYKNGYGGSARFTYSSDGRSVGEYQYLNYNRYNWPTIGFSYVVSETRLNDGRNADLRTTYAYTTRCYAQWGSVPAGAVNCAEANAPEEYGPLVGHQTTTQTSYDYDGTTILNRQVTTFSQNANNSIGRPTQIDVQNGAGSLLTRSSHTYASLAINGVANMFTYTSETKNYQYNNGAGSTTLSTKTTYEYNSANQGGSQYGNLTHIRTYDSDTASTPVRTTARWYYPRTEFTNGLLSGHWVVGLMGAESLYSGNMGDQINGAWYYYDNDSDPATPPTQGKLMRSRSFIPITCAAVPAPGPGSGCAHARQTIDSTYTYDVYGNQTGITTHSGYGYRTFNSSYGQVYNAFAPTSSARTTTIAYETTYNLYPISTTNPLNQTTSFQIYGFNGVGVTGFQKQPGLLKEVTGPDSVTTKYEYDPFGRLHAVYDGYSFTGFDNTNAWDGNPLSRTRYYDNSWNGTPQLNPSGHQPFPIVSQTRPGSSAISRTEVAYFDGFGRIIQNQTRSAQVDVGGVDTERDILTTTAYNAQGQVACATVPYDVEPYTTRGGSSGFLNHACTGKANTGTSYDALGRPTAVTAPDGTATNYTYSILNIVTVDSANLLAHTKIIDANNHVTGHFANSRGQLVLAREYTGLHPSPTADADTRYSYDTMGNLTAVLTTNTSNSQPLQEGALSYTQMGYDGYGRKVSMTDPDMGSWTYKYNAAGSLTEQRDANLARLCFTYDSLDRLQYKRHDNDNDGCESSDTQLAFYDYYAVDAGGGYVGRLKEIQWSASTSTDRETFAYDTLGRLTSHTRLIYNRSYTMSYSSFDALHRPTTITYPNGQTSVTTYDREGPNTLANSGTNLISNIRFNGMGQMTTLQRSSGGIHTTYLYHPQTDVANGGLGDSNFRLKTIQHGAAGTGNAWPDFTYEYDKVGNISKMTTVSTAGTDTQSFGYDHLNRLISASASGVSPTYSHTYGYNKIGNLTNNGGVSQTYGSSSHVHALTNAGGVTYGYDNNGNMTSRDAAGTANDYTHTFNVENELVSVSNNGSTTTFAYDAAGIRVKTVAPNGTVTDYPFPGYEVESPTSSPTVRLTFSIAGQAVALKVMGSSTATYYLYNDHLGSTSTMSTTTGGTVSGSTARYYPFGSWRTEPTASDPNGSPLTDRGFTGHLHNNLGNAPDDIGLVYMNARWYLPYINRFVSADSIVPDPANPQSFNRYSYAYNNPLRFRDVDGHRPCEWVCPGDWIPVGSFTGAGYNGPWDIQQQRQNAQKAEALLVEVRNTGVGIVWEPADWAIAASDGFQWYDSIGMLPIIPAAAGRWVDDALSWAGTIIRNADTRVLRWGLEGSIEAAQAAARNSDAILPGLFRYGSDMPSIPGYQRHHLWPEGLGGPGDGWAIYIQVSPDNFHTARGGIQPWVDQQLMDRTGLGLNEMREWARSNPDQLLPMLREIYYEIGVDFPY